ncbi:MULTISPECIES: hypothetical protein [unclassified Sphingomonas]|uniref:hypothetical protein n=1 Tax=unclassified Sphingomonas TaxID=196159 RepID=UPI0006F24667|nr:MULTISPECIES: hypothetical protein [unclassified Sphingomonas]KQM24583.1 hypothetical protein ASE58_14240 [Sphingomonas sp. Leaf9]KQM42242.1 hypothetical protein ASE57_14245 [Sphingomonas sp. Leaf11]
MDSTSPLQSPGFLGALTTVNLVIIAVLAVVTIIGIAYGMKLARARRQGVRELEDAGHLERGDTPVEEPAAVESPRPVAPAAPTPAPVERVAAPPPARVEPVASPAPAPAAPVEPVAEPIVAPVPVAVTTPPAPAAPAAGATDLTRLKGLGPKVAAMLVEQGVPDIATLATLDAARAEAVAAQLAMFAPRMAKDRWVEQARFLAAGDVAGFEATFGKL